MTVPGVSRICRAEADAWGDYWRFTSMSSRRLFEDAFGEGTTTVEAYGNVLTASAQLYGLASEELRDADARRARPQLRGPDRRANREALMAVRAAGPDDAPAVAALLADFRNWWGHREPSDEEVQASVRRIMEGGDAVYLLAGDNEGVCQVRFRWSVWKSAEDAWLEDLYVRDDARGRGLGRELVEAAIALARERGARRIELDVNESNEAAIALYEACGFALEPKPPGRTLFIGRRL